MIREVMAKELESLIKTGALVLVDYSATWCGPCKRQHLILEELANKTDGKITIVSLDIDKNRDYAMQQNIRAVPTIQFFKENKIVVFKDLPDPKDRLVGVKPLALLEQIITAL